MASLTTITNLMKSIDPNQTAQYLAKLSKELYYLLQNLDSLNVTSINTSMTTIESEDGTTILDGGQIIMKDTAGTTRLIMGVNGSGVFQYTLYDDTGAGTLSIDSNGTMVILGGSGVANLTDSGDLATRNTVNGTYIDSNSITTTHITAGAVTASEISVGNLSAISANIGTITSGSITSNTTISVGTDLTVGNSVTIGTPTASAAKDITFYDSGSSLTSATIVASKPNYPTDSYTTLLLNAYDIGFFSYNLPKANGSTIATQSWVSSQGYGDITGVTASTGLTGGGTSGAVSLSIDDDEVITDRSNQNTEINVYETAGTWYAEFYTGGTHRGTVTLT